MHAPSGSRRSSALLVLALLLSACPGRSAAPVPSPSVSSGAPSRGVARVAFPDEPATLNPLTQTGLAAETRTFLPLLAPRIVAGGSGPGIVRATFEQGSNDLTVEPGSTWSDGTAITGRDVERTWKLVRASGLPFEGLEAITSVRMDGDRVRITPPTAMPRLLQDGFHLLPPDFSASAYETSWPTSGGPFTLDAWTSGLQMSFVANPTSPGGVPRLAGLNVSFVTDPDAALALFRRNEIDVLSRYGAPGWHERLTTAGAKVSPPGDGAAVALVLRAPATSAARTRMLARIDLARINAVLVQGEAAYGCDAEPERPPCDRNIAVGAPGPEVGTLTLAYSWSDPLAHRIATALREMLGPVRLQHRSAEDLWRNLDDIDLALLTGLGRDDLTAFAAAGKGPDPKVHTLFVARGSLAARLVLPAPGTHGPFDGAGTWPSEIAPA